MVMRKTHDRWFCICRLVVTITFTSAYILCSAGDTVQVVHIIYHSMSQYLHLFNALTLLSYFYRYQVMSQFSSFNLCTNWVGLRWSFLMKSTMNELLSDIPYNLVPPQELGGITPITCYSELYDGSALFDSTNALRKFKIPAIPQDLITGYERWVDKLSRSPPKPKALDWIILSCLESNKLVKELLQATVITTRGVLSR